MIATPSFITTRNSSGHTNWPPQRVGPHSRVTWTICLLHSPNGITAMFIATGQDVANVAESCSGIIYTELTPSEDRRTDSDYIADLLLGQLAGQRPVGPLTVRQGMVFGAERAVAKPGPLHRRLASGMGQLDSHGGHTVLAAKVNHPF